MKKIIIVLLIVVLTGCGNSWERIFVDLSSSNQTYGVWLSYLDYDELLKGKSESEFQKNVQDMMANLESLGINRIYAHVSMFTDAIYPSDYYPTSRYVTGKLGKEADYDPLEVIISEAQLRQIQVEAWINPLRSFTIKEMKELADTYPVKQWYNDAELRNKNLMVVDQRYYMNPGSQDVIDLINQVVKELCTNYALNGIHIDDYFYPAGMNETMDELTYSDYIQKYPETSLEDYRRAMTDHLVSSIYQNVKTTNHSMTFSISVNANTEANYNSYFADVVKWATESGYCDVIIPQVYYGFENRKMPFTEVVDQWAEMVNSKVDIVYGLTAAKVGEVDAYAQEGRLEWQENVDILSRQVQYVKENGRGKGVAFYRYYSMFYPKAEVKQQMKIELSKLKEVLSE